MAEYSEEQRKQLQDLLGKWRSKLRLDQWIVRVQWDRLPDSGEGTVLEIQPVEGRQFANLRVGTFFEQTQSQAENAACHEMFHLGFNQMDVVVEQMLEQLSPQMRELLRTLYHEQVERIVDWLALITAPMDELR